MFLKRDRPLAVLTQLAGVVLIAYDLLTGAAWMSTGIALVGLALFVVGSLLANRRM